MMRAKERQPHISLLGCFISSTPRFLSGCRWPGSWLLAPLHLLPNPLSKLILCLFTRVLHPPRVSIAKAAQIDISGLVMLTSTTGSVTNAHPAISNHPFTAERMRLTCPSSTHHRQHHSPGAAGQSTPPQSHVASMPPRHPPPKAWPTPPHRWTQRPQRLPCRRASEAAPPFRCPFSVSERGQTFASHGILAKAVSQARMPARSKWMKSYLLAWPAAVAASSLIVTPFALRASMSGGLSTCRLRSGVSIACQMVRRMSHADKWNCMCIAAHLDGHVTLHRCMIHQCMCCQNARGSTLHTWSSWVKSKMWPCDAAMCTGVLPLKSSAWTSAPYARRSSAISLLPSRHAYMMHMQCVHDLHK